VDSDQVIVQKQGMLERALDSDLFHSFKATPTAIVAAVVALLLIGGALLAPWVAPHNVMDLKTLELNNALIPPAWLAEGKRIFLLGTDEQGRDILSSILYGSRISILVGICSVLLAAFIGVTLGLLAGYLGGRLDAFIMRVADVQLSFPAILIALLIDGVARAVLPRDSHSDWTSIGVLILSIA
jgi:peptide/nickel transport system permease protein